MRKILILLFFMVFIISGCKHASRDSSKTANISKTEMRTPVRKTEVDLELIRVSEDGRRFVGAESGERFVIIHCLSA